MEEDVLTRPFRPAAAGAQLHLDDLFVDRERWGWEYVDLGLPRPSPEAGSGPQQPQPAAPDETWAQAALLQAQHARPRARRLRWVALALALIAVGSGSATWFLIWGAVTGFLFYRVMAPTWQVRRALEEQRGRFQTERALAAQQYDRHHREWTARVAAHEEAERARLAQAHLWYPVLPDHSAARLDVCGGTAAGWATLMTTLGTSLLGSGADLLVLDLTDGDVSAELRGLTAALGQPVSHLDAIADLPRLRLVAGSDHDRAAEVLARAVHAGRGDDADSGDQTSLDRDVLERVLRCLGEPLTMPRILSALSVLARTYDAADDSLSPEEHDRLLGQIDGVDSNPDLKRRLSVLLARLSPLRGAETARDGRFEGPELCEGLSVVTVAGDDSRLEDTVQRILFHSLLLALGPSRAASDRVLVVAGADRLGRSSLEAMARRAARASIRLVYLFAHLRDDVVDLAGQGSATLFMRLGGAKEAEEAAKLVGRNHRFVLSQLTESVGRTLGVSTGTSDTWQQGDSETVSDSASTSRTYGSGLLPDSSRSQSVSHSTGTSRSRSWAETRTLSDSLSTQDGATTARSYDYVAEPTAFQELPPTAFIAVVQIGARRQVVAGDCNPGITQLDRVSPTPLQR